MSESSGRGQRPGEACRQESTAGQLPARLGHTLLPSPDVACWPSSPGEKGLFQLPDLALSWQPSLPDPSPGRCPGAGLPCQAHMLPHSVIPSTGLRYSESQCFSLLALPVGEILLSSSIPYHPAWMVTLLRVWFLRGLLKTPQLARTTRQSPARTLPSSLLLLGHHASSSSTTEPASSHPPTPPTAGGSRLRCQAWHRR